MLQKSDTIVIEDTPSKETAWGELSSLNESKYPSHLLYSNQTIIGRLDNNDICISDKRLSGMHLKILKFGESYFVEDLSTNGTYISNKKIGKGNQQKLENGDIIYLLHQSKVKAEDTIGFIFKAGDFINLRRTSKIASPLQKQQREEYSENLICLLCLDYLYQSIALEPCGHNVFFKNFKPFFKFCGSCLSNWIINSDKCPQCKQNIVIIKKNSLLNEKVSRYLKDNPDKKRSQKQYLEMNKTNRITCEKLILADLHKHGSIDNQLDYSFEDE